MFLCLSFSLLPPFSKNKISKIFFLKSHVKKFSENGLSKQYKWLQFYHINQYMSSCQFTCLCSRPEIWKMAKNFPTFKRKRVSISLSLSLPPPTYTHTHTHGQYMQECLCLPSQTADLDTYLSTDMSHAFAMLYAFPNHYIQNSY